jgi:hypothetical protein
MKEGGHPFCIREQPALPLMNRDPKPHAAGRHLQQTSYESGGTRGVLIHISENKPWGIARGVVVGVKLLVKLGLATCLINKAIGEARMVKQPSSYRGIRGSFHRDGHWHHSASPNSAS